MNSSVFGGVMADEWGLGRGYRRRAWAVLLAAVTFLLLVGGCASAPPSPPREVMLRPAVTGVFADVYLPSRPVRSPAPAVLVIGGSEGGIRGADPLARELAVQGYPAMALAYFGLQGLPSQLSSIPLEYFATASRTLATQPGVDASKIVVFGTSRGSEAALLTAARFPALIDAVVAVSPSSVAYGGYPAIGVPGWTLGGVPVPTASYADFGNPDPPDSPEAVIPVERVRGPVLTMCGEADAVWPSCAYARTIVARADRRPALPPAMDLDYPGAGHAFLLSTVPPGAPPTATVPRYGGTYGADAQARADAEPRLLAFLAAL